MRTALLVNGLLRHYEYALPTTLSMIKDSDTFDVFLSSSTHSQVVDKRLTSYDITQEDIDRIHSIFGKQLIAEYYETEMDRRYHKEVLFPRVLARIIDKEKPTFVHHVNQWIKMQRGMQMIDRHAMKNGFEYDRVLYIRPDVILREYLDMDKYDLKQGLWRTDDIWAFGTPKDMRSFASVVNTYGMWRAEHVNSYCSEQQALQHIRFCGIQDNRRPWKWAIARNQRLTHVRHTDPISEEEKEEYLRKIQPWIRDPQTGRYCNRPIIE
jgi:hypothetical protein